MVVSVNAVAGGGGGLSLIVSFFCFNKNVAPQTFLSPKTNDCVNFDVSNVIIGVDMKFEKGLNWGCRDNFTALLMTLSYHSLEN